MTAPADCPPRVSLAAIFITFLRIGALSFGGGLSGWIYRYVVQQRRWLTEQEFLAALTLSQILPGANVSNMSVHVGQRLRGVAGAAAALLGLLIIPFFGVLGLVLVYEGVAANPIAQAAIAGVTAAAVGLLLLVGWESMRNIRGGIVGAAVLVATVVAVGVLRWPLVPVVLCLAPISVAGAWFRKT